jgi:type IV secretion system protein TrbL
MPDSDEGDEKRPANSGVSADVAEETNVIRPAQEPSAAPAQPNGVAKSNNPKQESEA